MDSNTNYVIISPELLYNIGQEMDNQSSILEENLNKVLMLLEQTSSNVKNEKCVELANKIKEENKKMVKLQVAMQSFSGLLIKISTEWKALKESGKLDEIINEMGLEDE